MASLAAYEAYAKKKMSADLGANLGPSALGYLLDLTFFGVTCHQMIVYHGYPSSDRMLIRVCLYWAFAVGVIHTIYQMWHMFDLFALSYGQFLGFMSFDKYAYYPTMVVAVALPVQLFYADRAYRLWRKQIWVAVCVLPIIVASVVCAIGATVTLTKQGYNPDLSTVRRWFFVWDGCTLASDIALAFLIIAGLNRAKTGWAHTDHTLSRFMNIGGSATVPFGICSGNLGDLYLQERFAYEFLLVPGQREDVHRPMLAVLNLRVVATKEPSSVMDSNGIDDSRVKGSHPYIHGRPNQGEDHQMEVLPRGKGLGTLRSNESLVLS